MGGTFLPSASSLSELLSILRSPVWWAGSRGPLPGDTLPRGWARFRPGINLSRTVQKNRHLLSGGLRPTMIPRVIRGPASLATGLMICLGTLSTGGCAGGDPDNPPVGSISIPKDFKEGSSTGVEKAKAKVKKARAGE